MLMFCGVSCFEFTSSAKPAMMKKMDEEDGRPNEAMGEIDCRK